MKMCDEIELKINHAHNEKTKKDRSVCIILKRSFKKLQRSVKRIESNYERAHQLKVEDT